MHKHRYSVRSFNQHAEFLAHAEITGREEVQLWWLQQRRNGAKWARVYNNTLSMRVDRWRDSKDTSALELVRTPERYP